MTVRDSVDTLREDLSNVLQDISQLTSELANIAQSGSQEAKDRLLLRIAAARRRANELNDAIQSSVKAGTQKIDTHVRENPYQAIIAAGAVGVLVGWMLGRRD